MVLFWMAFSYVEEIKSLLIILILIKSLILIINQFFLQKRVVIFSSIKTIV